MKTQEQLEQGAVKPIYKNLPKGGRSHGMTKTKTYRIWTYMKSRCTNPKSTYYSDYGGRGIIFCEEWNKFECFYKDMGIAPKGMQLDRVDNDKGYSRENCRWITPSSNNFNRRIPQKTSTLPIGVRIIKQSSASKRYGAQVKIEGNHYYLGGFPTQEDAGCAYEKMCIEWYGCAHIKTHKNRKVKS